MAESRNQDATIYCGNLDERVKDEMLFELMLQVGPVVNVHVPRDRVMNQHQGYGFTEFLTERDAEYAVKIMNQVKLFGKPMRVNKASSDKKQISDIGAELFVGNLDLMVDERILYETFSRFGTLVKPPTISRNEDGRSKGFGFVSFDNFESADAAIESMDNQFLSNESISVGYAFKHGGKGNERHGDASERLLALQAKKNVSPTIVMKHGPADKCRMFNLHHRCRTLWPTSRRLCHRVLQRDNWERCRISRSLHAVLRSCLDWSIIIQESIIMNFLPWKR